MTRHRTRRRHHRSFRDEPDRQPDQLTVQPDQITVQPDQLASQVEADPASPPPTLLSDPHHSRADIRLTAMAERRGWLKGTRWPTDAAVEELIKAKATRPLTIKERATIAVLNGLADPESRIVQQAAKTIVAMEAQNQSDDLKQPPRRKRQAQQPQPTQQIVIVDGNLGDAKRQLAERIGRLAAHSRPDHAAADTTRAG